MHKSCSQVLALLACSVIIVGFYQVGLMPSWEFWKQVGMVSLLVSLALLLSGGYDSNEDQQGGSNQ